MPKLTIAELTALKRARKDQPINMDGLTDGQKSFVGQVNGQYARMLARVYQGVNSPTQAIKTKCLDCTAWNIDEAKRCQIQTCPLWNLNVRYFKRDLEAEAREAQP